MVNLQFTGNLDASWHTMMMMTLAVVMINVHVIHASGTLHMSAHMAVHNPAPEKVHAS